MSAALASARALARRWVPLLACWLACELRADRVFLFLQGLPGESTEVRHKDWIELRSFQEGVARANPPPARPAFEPLSLAKSLDRTSPRLVELCGNGKSISLGVLESLTSGATSLRYLKVTLTNVTVTAFSQSGAATGGGPPEEHVSLSFLGVTWTYTVFSSAGLPLQDITCSWDRTTGKGEGGAPTSDTDEDGLPDDYERLYGLNEAKNDANDDPDGDGVSNLDEFRAGTRPNARDSVLRSTGLLVGDGKVRLRWSSVPGKTYRVLAAPDILGPFEFIQITGPATEDETESELEFQSTATRRFFLIAVD